MSVRNLAAAGLAIFALGGPLLGLGILTGGGVIAFVGGAALWLGPLLIAVALLQLGRSQQQQLRSQGEVVRKLSKQVAALTAAATSDELPPALQERLAVLEANVDAALSRHRSEVLQVVDARVLGIHETVRDLGASTGLGAGTGRVPGDRP